MGMKRTIARNVAKQNMKEVQKYSSVLDPRWKNQSPSDINLFVKMARNGITIEDLKREVANTRQKTYEDTVVSVMRTIYATLAVSLVKQFNFTQEQCFDVLYAVDQNVAMCIDQEEMLAEAEEIAGIRFNTKDGVERIEKV